MLDMIPNTSLYQCINLFNLIGSNFNFFCTWWVIFNQFLIKLETIFDRKSEPTSLSVNEIKKHANFGFRYHWIKAFDD